MRYTAVAHPPRAVRVTSTDIKDLIERYQTAPDFFYFRNRGEARIRGVEAGSAGAAGRGTSRSSRPPPLTRGVALDDDAALDDMPPATFTLGCGGR
ncbi:MAG: TonB-dependent receptor [Ignavibacteriales bacterium]|nr:TonB-dependent receptor [Ignavibacteriales bacterium]